MDGYAIGIDLGTSNTVAVLRWPDGRIRPLLFDGQPIMPSAVYLDDHGRFHVGRDAQRMAQLDPARYEPNPKRRVDEPAVLLGDREVPTVELLAALLRAIAATAVEAVGFLPPAVLTHPAAWGSRRRELLHHAAAQAGWPPVHLVPEPVAAARYFAEVLRRPIPVGASLAVFDFGGGTLDVAVVRNEDGRFAVLGSGGIEDLGGLDLDSAIVDHMGAVLQRVAPDVWARLRTPAGVSDARQRRLFWEDVRGAKEMLSRTAVAPISVPGVEQALHLTRDELEHAAAPLMRRALNETVDVIARCHLAPHQLAGMFLVGGSSRVPMVARVLHAELGLAPTVLEQPELPVAEGALAELVLVPASPAGAVMQTAPVPPTAPVPLAAVPTQPIWDTGTPVSPGPAPAAPPASFLPHQPPGSSPPFPSPPPQASPPQAVPPQPAPSPRKRRTALWISIVAGVAVLALVGGLYYYFTGRYDQVDFVASIGEPAATVAVPPKASMTSDGTDAHVVGDRAYMSVPVGKKLTVIGYDLAAKGELWRTELSDEPDRWSGITALPTVVIAFEAPYDSSKPTILHGLDTGSGKELWRLPVGAKDERFYFDTFLIWVDRKEGRLRKVDLRTGNVGALVASAKEAKVVPVLTEDDERYPARYTPTGFETFDDSTSDDYRLVQILPDKKAEVIDTRTMKVVASQSNVGEPRDLYVAYDKSLFTANATGGYQLVRYDLGSMKPATIYRSDDTARRPIALQPCRDRVCVLDQTGSDGKTNRLLSIDADGGKWTKDVAGGEYLIPIGDRVMVTERSGTLGVVLFDPSGARIVGESGRYGVRITDADALLFNKSPSTAAVEVSVAGLDARSGQKKELGVITVRTIFCSWNTKYLVCPGEKEFGIWQFGA